MLKENEKISSIENLYCLSGAKVEQRIEEMKQRIDEIRMSIETLWTN
jgi:hypothetical protein